jgi:hypothetical protein
VLLEQVVASPLTLSTLLQVDTNLFQTCHNSWEQAMRTHPGSGLTTTLLQLVIRLVAICAFLAVYNYMREHCAYRDDRLNMEL